MIKIEKGISLPYGYELDHGGGVAARSGPSSGFPFVWMELGDSFVVSTDDAPMMRAYATKFKKYCRAWGWNYCSRKIGPRRIRLWRIA